MKHSRFYAILRSLTVAYKCLMERETTTIGRQRILSLIYYTLFLSTGLSISLLTRTGPSTVFYVCVNSIFLFSILSLFTAYIVRLLHLKTAISLMTLIACFSTSAEMIYCSLSPTDHNLMLIVGNMVLLAVNTVFSFAASLKYNAMICSTITVLDYLLCVVITDNDSLEMFFFTFLMSFMLISFLGFKLVKGVDKMEMEYMEIRKEELDIFHIFRLKKDQVKAFIELADKQQRPEQTENLLDLLGEKQQRRLIENVVTWIRHKETDLSLIETVLPELTQSEREICRLILQGKKLGEICLLLNKSETNINTQRAHIRKKLGLQSSDNLSLALKERMTAH